MKLAKVLKTTIAFAPELIGLLHPGIGALMRKTIESLANPTPEPQPSLSEASIDGIANMAATDILKTVERVTGKDIADDERFCESIRRLGEVWIDIRQQLRDAKSKPGNERAHSSTTVV